MKRAEKETRFLSEEEKAAREKYANHISDVQNELERMTDMLYSALS